MKDIIFLGGVTARDGGTEEVKVPALTADQQQYLDEILRSLEYDPTVIIRGRTI